MRSRISTKFASKASTNQSQVRRGGIVAGPGPGAASGPLGAGGTRPAGAESLLRRVCGLVVFMVTFSGVLSQSSIFGQNPKIWYQEFNNLQTPKLSKKQLCDRTRGARFVQNRTGIGHGMPGVHQGIPPHHQR